MFISKYEHMRLQFLSDVFMLFAHCNATYRSAKIMLCYQRVSVIRLLKGLFPPNAIPNQDPMQPRHKIFLQMGLFFPSRLTIQSQDDVTLRQLTLQATIEAGAS